MKRKSPTRLRKTKVIATIGPASDDVNTLKQMIVAGMNVARLNMSHGDVESHTATLQRIRQAAQEVNATVAIMVDNRGREIRTGSLAEGSVTLARRQQFSLYSDNRIGDRHGVSLTFSRLHLHARLGDRILVDDGQIELRVETIQDNAGIKTWQSTSPVPVP